MTTYTLNCRGDRIEVNYYTLNFSGYMIKYFPKHMDYSIGNGCEVYDSDAELYVNLDIKDMRRALDYIADIDNCVDERLEKILTYLDIDH